MPKLNVQHGSAAYVVICANLYGKSSCKFTN